MRIASIYDFTASPPRGGNHVHALQLMRKFIALGHQVLTWGDSSVPGAIAVPKGRDAAEDFRRKADVLYVRVDANPIGDHPELVRLLQTVDLPVVWEINAPANETLAFSWLKGRPLPGEPSRFADRPRRHLHARRKMLGIWREEALRRSLAMRTSAAICVSAALARYATEGLGIRSVTVLPNGADHEVESVDGPVASLPQELQERLVVIYTGSPMYPWQGLDVLEQTIKLCEEADDPISFLLLLNQESPRPLESRNVLTKLRVPHSQVSDYVRAADVGVAIHPEYFWSPWRFHGSPMKMFDYMACGTPVVASSLGQMREIVQHGRNGFLFDNTPVALRDLLLEIGSDRYDLAGIARAARLDVERTYNWQYIAKRTIEVLEAVVSSNRNDVEP